MATGSAGFGSTSCRKKNNPISSATKPATLTHLLRTELRRTKVCFFLQCWRSLPMGSSLSPMNLPDNVGRGLIIAAGEAGKMPSEIVLEALDQFGSERPVRTSFQKRSTSCGKHWTQPSNQLWVVHLDKLPGVLPSDITAPSAERHLCVVFPSSCRSAGNLLRRSTPELTPWLRHSAAKRRLVDRWI